MQRRGLGALFVGLVGGVALGALPTRAQGQGVPVQTDPDLNQVADERIGQVAAVQGSATVTRGNATAAALQVNDGILKGDVLATGANSSLGVTFDDETTFSLAPMRAS